MAYAHNTPSSVIKTSNMKNIVTRFSKEKIKYVSMALGLVALAVFVVVPLMPQIHSTLTKISLHAGTSKAEDGGGGDGGGGGGDGGGGGGDASAADPGSGANAGNGDAGASGDAGGGGTSGSGCCGSTGPDSGANAGNGDAGAGAGGGDGGGTGGGDGGGGYAQGSYYAEASYYAQGTYYAQGSYFVETWTPYCTGGNDVNGHNWQWWEQSNTNPIQYRFLRNGDGACVPPPVDVCPNIAGDQATIPAGMIKDVAGNCVTPPVDVCPNIAGNQATIPAGMIKDSAGNCVTPSPNIPVCDNFVASPATITAAGTVSLTWNTTNADSVSIDNGIGAVAVDGTTNKAVAAADTTFILTATKGAESRTCQASVHYTPLVVTPKLSCDSFSISPSSVDSGNTTTMTWSTSNADSVSIDGGIGAVGAGGSRSITVTADKTYILTALRGTESVTCSAPVSITTHGGGGGGGGGGSSLRCSLFEASDISIIPGGSTTLHWRTVGGSKVMIDNGALATTTGSAVREGTLKVSPATNTKYKLTVLSGTRKATCSVDIHVGGITVISNRDQQPLTSISFSNIPYTGFEAGPTLTSIFYVLLTLWSLGIAYVLVIKRGTVFGLSLAGHALVAGGGVLLPHTPRVVENTSDEHIATHAVLPTITNTTVDREAPINLPVASMPPVIYGYAAAQRASVEALHDTQSHEQDLVTKLEGYAHEHNVLLSSDALRMVVDHANTEEASMELLIDIVNRAKAAYAREDGWVVLNRERVMTLFQAASVALVAPVAVPVATPVQEVRGAHTLAEAILTGNTTTAYSFLGENAIEVIADTAESLDGIVRARKGTGTAPDMLVRAAEGVADEKIKAAILALVTAIDGTYSDQTAAVRLAVIKALKAVA